MKNKLVVEIFRDVAEILEIKGENVFRIRAYLRAADTVEGLAEDLETIAAQGRLTDIPGIGKDLSAKIEEIITTGKLAFLEELKKTIPDGLLELLNIPSVGPKTAKLLSDTLQIKSVSDLKKAIEAGKLANIPGIKEKTVENIAKGIALLERGKERMPLGQAIAQAENFQRALQGLKEVQSLSVAGSLRRRRETIRDIDILVVSEQPQKVMPRGRGRVVRRSAFVFYGFQEFQYPHAHARPEKGLEDKRVRSIQRCKIACRKERRRDLQTF